MSAAPPLPAAAVLSLIEELKRAGELVRLENPPGYWSTADGLGYCDRIVERALELKVATMAGADADGRPRRIRAAENAGATIKRLEQQDAEAKRGAPLRI